MLGAYVYVQSASRERPEVQRRAHQVGHRARSTGDLPTRSHSLSDGLRRARDVHAAPLLVFTGHVSHMRANGPYGYGSPLCVLRVSSGIQVPIAFSSHALLAPFKLLTWGRK